MNEEINEDHMAREHEFRIALVIAFVVVLCILAMVGCQVHADSVEKGKIQACVEHGGTWKADPNDGPLDGGSCEV